MSRVARKIWCTLLRVTAPVCDHAGAWIKTMRCIVLCNSWHTKLYVWTLETVSSHSPPCVGFLLSRKASWNLSETAPFPCPKSWNTLPKYELTDGRHHPTVQVRTYKTYLYNLDIWSFAYFFYILSIHMYMYDCICIWLFNHPPIFICCKAPWVVSSV